MRERDLAVLGVTGFRKLAYVEWGERSAKPPVVCVHGLTRNARDFDDLAAELGQDRLAVSADMAGRGRSDWLPSADMYDFPLYMADCAALMARLDAASIDWVGTSMGGLIGLFLAAQPKSPIRRLVLNDVGAELGTVSLDIIRAYVTYQPNFADVEAAEAHFRKVHAPFGALTNAQWRRMAETSLRPRAEGGLTFHYDPKIGEKFVAATEGPPVPLWAFWDALTCPTLILRGAESSLLLPETVAEMVRRKPGTQAVEIPGCGHAPALMDAHQMGLVRAFLDS
jgi:pimeloyl-ACP methyl ester carboxylesterase